MVEVEYTTACSTLVSSFFSSPSIVSHRLLSTVRKTVFTVMAIKRMTTLTSLSPGSKDFNHDLQRYKEGSKKVRALIAPFLLPFYLVTRSAHRKWWMGTEKSATTMVQAKTAGGLGFPPNRRKRYSLPRSLSCRSTTSQRLTNMDLSYNRSFPPYLSHYSSSPVKRVLM